MCRKITISNSHNVNGLLSEVKYTDDPSKLFPRLYYQYADTQFGVFSDYGLYKNTSWKWKKEWRYIFKFYQQRAFMQKVDGRKIFYDVPFDYYDLKLDEDKLKQLEVMTSPYMDTSNRKKLDMVIQKYLPGTAIIPSTLA